MTIPISCKTDDCTGEVVYVRTEMSGDDPPKPFEIWECERCGDVRRFKPLPDDAG